MARTEAIEVELSGRAVRVTSPSKVFFAERGETKLDLIRFYDAVGPSFLRAVGGRPSLLQRFPDGADGESFFQKRVPAGAPDWLRTTTVSTPNGTTSNAVVLADIAHVGWAVNLGCLGFHPWPLHADAPGRADELRIDLDPSPGVDRPMLREAAGELRALLDELGITSFPKTSGNRGIHVHVRVAPSLDSYDVRRAAVSTARMLAERRPDLVTDRWWKEERGARVFVDFNQNAPHKTVFGAWSVRARPGAQVSTPFAWDELDDIDFDALTIATVPDRLAAQGDPWTGIDEHPSDLAPLLARWDDDLAAGVGDAPWPPVYPKMPHEPPRVAPSRARGSGR